PLGHGAARTYITRADRPPSLLDRATGGPGHRGPQGDGDRPPGPSHRRTATPGAVATARPLARLPSGVRAGVTCHVIRSTGARVRRLFVALVALAAVLAVPVPAQSAQVASYWGGSFNMDHGNGDYAGVNWTDRADAVIASIKSRQPAFLAVQETCYQWVTRIRDA